MKTMVISGINFYEGGPLSVFHDCLDNILESGVNKEYKIISFVHKKELFSKYSKESNIEFLELPRSRNNYFYRLWYEFVYFRDYSKKNKIDIWLSLHDITPNVIADKRYVYCHNPSPFMKKNILNLRFSAKNYLFSLFYKYLYRINIHKNTAVIVQQEWIRNEFRKMYGTKNIIVARPTLNLQNNNVFEKTKKKNEDFLFIYPSYPRFFKNFEVICEACKILEEKGVTGFKVLLTIDGSENKYSNYIIMKYGNLSSIKFTGLLTRSDLFEKYKVADAMIFPSKLETWGLPISEFKSLRKPIILADLAYAYETLGSYNKACFFDVGNAYALAEIMENEVNGLSMCSVVESKPIKEPYCKDWDSLLIRLLND